MSDKEEITMREIADAYINKDEDAIKIYREKIAKMASGFIERVNVMNTPLFATICMAMSISYTKAMIDADMITSEQMHDYTENEENKEKSRADMN